MDDELDIDDLNLDELDEEIRKLPTLDDIVKQYFEKISNKHAEQICDLVLDTAIAIGCVYDVSHDLPSKFKGIKREVENWSESNNAMKYPCLLMGRCCAFYLAWDKKDRQVMAIQLIKLLNMLSTERDMWIPPDDFWKDRILDEMRRQDV